MATLTRWGALGLVVLTLTLGLGESSPVAAQPNHGVDIDVRVWQSVGDAERLYVSARSAGGSWKELGTVPLHMGLSSSQGYRYGAVNLPVALPGAPFNRVVNVEVRVWQSRTALEKLYVNARIVDSLEASQAPVRLGMSSLSRSGRYRYMDITLTVPFPDTHDDLPEIVFWGDISERKRAHIREKTASVVEFFDVRHGVRVPGLEIHVVADDAALAEAALETEGKRFWVGFAQYRDGRLFIHVDASDRAVEHLYFHAIQDHLAKGRDWGPWWLNEGAADYAEHVYWDARGETPLAEAVEFDRWAASYTSFRLDQLEAGSPVGPESFGTVTEGLAAFAVAWLVQQAGEDSLIAYYRNLPNSTRWTEAFERAFGFPFADVYPAFAAYRAELIPVRREVTGKVLGPDGGPVEDWRIDIEAFPAGAQRRADLREDASSERFSGDFTSKLPDGTYTLSLSTRCGDSWVDLGWYGGESGFTASYADVRYVVVEGEDVEGIVIRLPALPDEMFPGLCSYGPRVAVSGVVVGLDGEPRSNVHLVSHDPVADIWPDNTVPNPDGSFTLRLPVEAAYQISAAKVCDLQGEITPIWGHDYEVQSETHLNDDGLLIVGNEDITGIKVQLLDPFACDP